MLFADRTRCHEFLPNPFRLLLSSFADVLLHLFSTLANKLDLRSEHLTETALAPAQADRLRLSLAKIAARVCLSSRRVVFHLSSNCPYQSLFRTVAASLLLDTG